MWTKTGEVGLSLLVSPLLGFAIAAVSIYFLKRIKKDGHFHEAPAGDEPPSRAVRFALIGSSTGVSLAHGSNDGQKGVGLVMMILIALLPGQFALSPDMTASQIDKARSALIEIESKVTKVAGLTPKVEGGLLVAVAHADTKSGQASATEVVQLAEDVRLRLDTLKANPDLKAEDKLQLRKEIYSLDSKLSALEKMGYPLAEIKPLRKSVSSLVEYAPMWVIVMIAISLGLGTMIGWKRVVKTIGEKIGSTKLTYAQGAVSQTVAMSMIGVSALAGVPVSTTHCLSSGVAGSMVASGSRVQKSTVKSIALAWVLTLPVTLLMSAGLFLGLSRLINH